MVRNTIAQYGILDDDICNFDETGFAMGVANTSKVVTRREYYGWRKVLQPGNREWVTAIKCINQDEVLPPTIIFKGKSFMEHWFYTTPSDWRFEVSDNRWTTDQIGIQWLEQSFIPHATKHRKGAKPLLIMDGHRSHLTPLFGDICVQNNIIAICMPPHSPHLLQPLDVGCFAGLKYLYGGAIQAKARLSVTHIDKVDFLSVYTDIRAEVYKPINIANSFASTGIIPYSPQQVLEKLNIHLETPTPPSRGSITSNENMPSTPCKEADLRRSLRSINKACANSLFSAPPEAIRQVQQMARGHIKTLHPEAFLRAENLALHAENAHQTKKRALPNRQILYDGGISAEDMLVRLQIEREANIATPPAPRRAAESGSDRPRQRCGNCREEGHKRNKCPLLIST